MRLTRPIFLLGAMLAASSVGCKPSMTLDAPEINITEKNLSFPGVAAGVPGSQTASATFKMSTSKLGAAANPDSSAINRIERMEITRIVIQARSGITDFRFLERLKISATNYDPSRDDNVGKPVVTILECPSGTQDCPLLYENVGPTLSFPIEPPVNLIPLWANTNLYLIITAGGTVPQVSWSVDVTFSLSVRWST